MEIIKNHLAHCLPNRHLEIVMSLLTPPLKQRIPFLMNVSYLLKVNSLCLDVGHFVMMNFQLINFDI